MRRIPPSAGPAPEGRDPPSTTTRRAETLASSLRGELPCIRCGYQLQGLSIRSVCPECGLAIRATLLAAVDPAADELHRLPRPRLVVFSLLAWSAGGALAVFAGWMLFGFEAAAALELQAPGARIRVAWAAVGAIALSGLGAAILVFPIEETPLRNRLAASVAVSAYVPLGILLWTLHGRVGEGIAAGTYLDLGRVDVDRSVLRLGIGLALIAICEGLRPNLRLLASRSLVMRTGRVDRQSMHALSASVLLAMGGDVLHLCASAMGGNARDAVWVGGTFLVATGSLFFSAGVLGVLRDSVRVAGVLLEPAPSLASVLGTAEEEGDALR